VLVTPRNRYFLDRVHRGNRRACDSGRSAQRYAGKLPPPTCRQRPMRKGRRSRHRRPKFQGSTAAGAWNGSAAPPSPGSTKPESPASNAIERWREAPTRPRPRASQASSTAQPADRQAGRSRPRNGRSRVTGGGRQVSAGVQLRTQPRRPRSVSIGPNGFSNPALLILESPAGGRPKGSCGCSQGPYRHPPPSKSEPAHPRNFSSGIQRYNAPAASWSTMNQRPRLLGKALPGPASRWPSLPLPSPGRRLSGPRPWHSGPSMPLQSRRRAAQHLTPRNEPRRGGLAGPSPGVASRRAMAVPPAVLAKVAASKN